MLEILLCLAKNGIFAAAKFHMDSCFTTKWVKLDCYVSILYQKYLYPWLSLLEIIIAFPIVAGKDTDLRPLLHESRELHSAYSIMGVFISYVFDIPSIQSVNTGFNPDVTFRLLCLIENKIYHFPNSN